MSSERGESSSNPLRRASTDVGWEFGVLRDSNNFDRVQCNFCDKMFSGGVYRLKQHVAGVGKNVRACPKATEEAKRKCREAIFSTREKKIRKVEVREEVIADVHVPAPAADSAASHPDRGTGIDRFVTIDATHSGDTGGLFTRQPSIVGALNKKRLHDVHQYLARWMYVAGIPFHALAYEELQQFVEAVGQYGPGYQLPSQYMVREPLLKEEVERTRGLLKRHSEECEATGCSLMSDAWSDKRRRSIINVCVNCRDGTAFFESREESAQAHTGTMIFEYIDSCVERVGARHVVQVVTDNASNNMAAKAMMLAKRPDIFWTCCAAHTLDLALEGIASLPRFSTAIRQAKALTVFIYSHHTTLAMMRAATRKRDIIRPGVTRFASAFLTLQSLLEKKEQLRLMFTSEEWSRCRFSRTTKGRASSASVLSTTFWSGISLAIRVFQPLVRVLRLVDGDRFPSMPYLHGELLEAKRHVMDVFRGVERHYRPIISIIEQKVKGRLDEPLHLTGYYLNPYYFYRNKSAVIGVTEYIEAFMLCVERFFPGDLAIQGKVTNTELLVYHSAGSLFGRPLAVQAYEGVTTIHDFSPVGWWELYGSGTPNLKRMAMRILSLTTSSSGCERNWSSFEGIHTKRRNRLETDRLQKLVYVQFNTRLLHKKRRGQHRDPLLGTDSTLAQGWLVEGAEDEDDVDPVTGASWTTLSQAVGADEALEPRRSARGVRDLDCDDFDSETSSQEVGGGDDMDFDSDEDREHLLVDAVFTTQDLDDD